MKPRQIRELPAGRAPLRPAEYPAARGPVKGRSRARRTAVPDSGAEITQEELNQMIASAAYLRAERRGFAAGHELEDWLEAEKEVKWQIAQGGL